VDTRDYRIRAPRAVAVRARDCDRCTFGWLTYANEHTPLGAYRARWIRRKSRLAFTELTATAAAVLSDGVVMGGEVDANTDPAEQVTVFRFAGGQACFQHPRDARLFAGTREHKYLEDWIEDLDEHVGRLAEQFQKG
jgi:hypothetical protein